MTAIFLNFRKGTMANLKKIYIYERAPKLMYSIPKLVKKTQKMIENRNDSLRLIVKPDLCRSLPFVQMLISFFTGIQYTC